MKSLYAEENVHPSFGLAHSLYLWHAERVAEKRDGALDTMLARLTGWVICPYIQSEHSFIGASGGSQRASLCYRSHRNFGQIEMYAPYAASETKGSGHRISIRGPWIDVV